MERTLVVIKPDGVHRGVVGQILEKFEDRGFRVVGLKMFCPPRSLIDHTYEAYRSYPFYEANIRYIMSGPVVAFVLEGEDAVRIVREIRGRANIGRHKSVPGTLRGEFTICATRNLMHTSDDLEEAEDQIRTWFKKEELLDSDLGESSSRTITRETEDEGEGD